MSIPKNPFAKSNAIPGKGDVVLSLLPPDKQVLTTFTYQYPLKLISPDPHIITITQPDQDPKDTKDQDVQTKVIQVTTIFLLTYGGGLIAGDSINLTLTINPHTRLALLTQGSTKIFKTAHTPTTLASTSLVSQQSRPTRQILDVKIMPHSSLVYLPDPNQPFSNSLYEQRQTFYVDPSGSSNLLFLDWVSEGRRARGESWTLTSWSGRNEVREFDEYSKGRLLIRDALLLFGDDLGAKTNGMGVIGTLVIYGRMFAALAEFFMREFKGLERIGAKTWTVNGAMPAIDGAESKDHAERQRERMDGLLWTAAQVRGFVLVKFGAKEVDGARRWLAEMLKKEGTVEREFGHQALLCLR
ncbi:hypothetical protein H2198_006540 [Neophaeococcomyces mojaviensis]|uniref:Uncharacterized protein n=1 Tax=Neophaeococcomyces mojaviensis TaxID=3383035 RepID=A0ACC3A2K4_9EURO|nr:hypothetical protein H2198_006540 [Knufia sp. JES_112]